jgi:hypothetical protein
MSKISSNKIELSRSRSFIKIEGIKLTGIGLKNNEEYDENYDYENYSDYELSLSIAKILAKAYFVQKFYRIRDSGTALIYNKYGALDYHIHCFETFSHTGKPKAIRIDPEDQARFLAFVEAIRN